MRLYGEEMHRRPGGRLGESYIDYKGRQRQKKCAWHVNCNCVYGCMEKFTEEARVRINKQYWSSSLASQQHFISHYVQQKRKKKTGIRKESRRQHTYNYHLPKATGGGTKTTEMCKNFFLKMLDIGEKVVMTVLKKVAAGDFLANDQGGKCNRQLSRPYGKDVIREHINRFPRISSHHCRSTTNRQYLEQTLSIKKMYDLYKAWCNEKGIIAEKEWFYREVFNTEFNLKKACCDFCESYSYAAQPCEDLVEKYNEHQQRKTEARESKSKDKSCQT